MFNAQIDKLDSDPVTKFAYDVIDMNVLDRFLVGFH